MRAAAAAGRAMCAVAALGLGSVRAAVPRGRVDPVVFPDTVSLRCGRVTLLSRIPHAAQSLHGYLLALALSCSMHAVYYIRISTYNIFMYV